MDIYLKCFSTSALAAFVSMCLIKLIVEAYGEGPDNAYPAKALLVVTLMLSILGMVLSVLFAIWA